MNPKSGYAIAENVVRWIFEMDRNDQLVLDWSTCATNSEIETTISAYRDLGGEDILEQFRFISFLARHRPDAFKRYRLFVDTVTKGVSLDTPLRNPPHISFIIGHFYCTLPYAQGALVDLRAARNHGARKQEVIDLLALGFLHAGPFGMNIISAATEDFLAAWDDDDGAPGVTWPDGWTVEPDIFASGITFESADNRGEMSSEDLEKLVTWHCKWEGETPKYVSFLAEHYPLALLAFRARYENAAQNCLPKQLIALCKIHLAACWGRADALRRAMHMARAFAVSKEHVVQVLAFAQLYVGDIGMDRAIQGSVEALSEWDI